MSPDRKESPGEPQLGESWQTEQEDVLLSADQTDPGITDVHSGSSLTGTDGTAYNTW